MSAFFAAAAASDASLTRNHGFDAKQAFAALREETLAGFDGHAVPSPSASHATQHSSSNSAPQSKSQHAAVEARLAAHRDKLAEAHRAAEKEAATAKASLRSRAHDVNSFHAVGGKHLPAPRVPLAPHLHHDLVDRRLHASTTQEHQARSVVHSPQVKSTSTAQTHHGTSAYVATPYETLVGQPRRTTERVRRVDRIQQEYRDGLLDSCVDTQLAHPHYQRPRPPPAVPVLRDDGDDGRSW
jgi:hypothetical protein